MGKKRLIGIFLSLAVLLLAAAAVAAGVMMERYPQRGILPEELYGAEQENLKDFALDVYKRQLLVLGAALGCIRVIGGVHFPRDVAVGAAAGVFCGVAGFWVLPALF